MAIILNNNEKRNPLCEKVGDLCEVEVDYWKG